MSTEIPIGEAMYENAYWRVDVAENIVVLTRLTAPFTRPSDVEDACMPIHKAFTRLGREGKRLLVDSRVALPPVNPVIEQRFAIERRRITQGFARVAILVETYAGREQAARLSKAHRATGVVPRAFLSIEAALEYLRAS